MYAIQLANSPVLHYSNSNNYDLPPSTITKPLPTRTSDAELKKSRMTKKEKKPKEKLLDTFKDDTPRAFARMMRLQNLTSSTGKGTGSRVPLDLDDGARP